MIWLTWRQFRLSALVVLVTLAAYAVALAVTGPQLAALYSESPSDFFQRVGIDDVKQGLFDFGTGLVYAVPAIVGVFWGAPMVARELEAGTHRLVWTQSVTRTRWLSTKLGLTALAALAAGLVGLALTWWCAPIDDAIAAGYSDGMLLNVPRVSPVLFGARGLVPASLAVLALVVGVTAGMLLRRTVAAMAVTLVAVVGLQIVLPVLVQEHLADPEVMAQEISVETIDGIMAGGPPGSGGDATFQRLEATLDEPGAWLLSQRTIGPSGEALDEFPAWTADCGGGRDAMAACLDRLTEEGYRQQMTYVPASDFWAIQALESALLVAVAAGLTGFCFWRIRRDV